MKNRAIFIVRVILFIAFFFWLFNPAPDAQTKKSTKPSIPDINGYLKNSVRTDVGGEGLWLPQLDDKLTHWLDAAPGFVGPVYYVHATNFQGLFKYEFSKSSRRLTPQAIKNEWTPAYLKTRYRLNDANGEATFEIEETKFINDNEEAFSTVEVFNTSAGRQTLSVTIIDLLTSTPHTHGGFSVIHQDISGHLKFKPTTYYFSDLEIEKYYAIQGLGFTRSHNTPLATNIALKPKAKSRFSVRLVFDNLPLEKSPKYKFDLQRNALGERINEFNRWYVNNVPEFDCSDEALKKMYYYRWYVVKKCSINARKYVPHHPYLNPVIYEGAAGRWFTKVIGLPLPLQIMEARWLNDKTLATGQARTALTKDDFFDYLNWTPFAIWQLNLVAPNDNLIKAALPKMKRFVAMEDAKDEDRDFLPTTWGSWITGMEYQPSFHYFTTPRWDHRKGDEFVTDDQLTKDPAIYKKFLAVERVDEATYYFLNNLATSKAARLTGDAKTASEYQKRAENIRRAVKAKMWDKQTKFFFDIHPRTDEKAIEAKQADGFFPFLFGLLATREEASVFDHLLNPKEFWTAYPVPSVSQDSPAFDAGGLWKVGPAASPEKPYAYVCNWNGPTWVFSNALVMDALGSAAQLTHDARLRDGFLELLNRHTKLQFRKGDLSVPCVVEHYNPQTGEALRWLADYFHSSYNDLLIRFLIGLTPREDELIEIAPLAKPPLRFSIKDVRYRNHKVSVNFNRIISISVDGKTIFHRPKLERIIYNPKTGRVEE